MPHLHDGTAGSFGSLLVTVILVLTALVYLRGWSSLRATSLHRIPAWRACSFLLGLFLIWLAAASPLSALDHELLTVHMLKHLLLMTFAPPLIWLGEPVRAWSESRVAPAFLPAIWRRRMSALRQPGKALARPEVCWLAAAAALVGWHVPSVFALAMHSPGWHFIEQSSFLVAGLLFWWPVVQPWPSVQRSDLSMILYLFFATLPCDILSGFLVFCDRVVYPVYLHSSHLFGFTALGDQQCAAALMWTCVTVVYLVAGAILAIQMLSPPKVFHTEFLPSASPINATSHNVERSFEAI
jgi:putative membrane protein